MKRLPMIRLCILLAALVVVAGCESPRPKSTEDRIVEAHLRTIEAEAVDAEAEAASAKARAAMDQAEAAPHEGQGGK